MNKDLTELVFILDKSGSMAGLEWDTIGGFNSMLGKQKQVEGECRITTVLSDNRYELLHDRIDIQAISPMTGREYQVGGYTVLLDAIGQTYPQAGGRPEEHSGGVPGRKRDVRHHHRRGRERQPGVFRRKSQGHDRGGENIRLGVRVPGSQHRRGGDGGAVRHFCRPGSGLRAGQLGHGAEFPNDEQRSSRLPGHPVHAPDPAGGHPQRYEKVNSPFAKNVSNGS